MSCVRSQLPALLRVLVGPGLLSMLLAGCLASLQGDPKRLYPIEEESAAVRGVAPPAFAVPLTDSLLLSEADRIARRNEIITARMYAIDLNYHEFESALRRERQQIGFWSTAANAGLTGSTALVNSAATKTALAAAATILTGSTSAFKDEILLHRTIDILITQMRAQRALVSARIIEKLNRSTAEYPPGLALTEVEEYYGAGTLNAAIVELGKTVGETAQAADAVRLTALTLTFSTDPNTAILKRYLYPQGVTAPHSPEALERLAAYLGVRGSTDVKLDTINLFLDNPKATKRREQLVIRARGDRLIP